jgi:hypothetical protein
MNLFYNLSQLLCDEIWSDFRIENQRGSKWGMKLQNGSSGTSSSSSSSSLSEAEERELLIRSRGGIRVCVCSPAAAPSTSTLITKELMNALQRLPNHKMTIIQATQCTPHKNTHKIRKNGKLLF